MQFYAISINIACMKLSKMTKKIQAVNIYCEPNYALTDLAFFFYIASTSICSCLRVIDGPPRQLNPGG